MAAISLTTDNMAAYFTLTYYEATNSAYAVRNIEPLPLTLACQRSKAIEIDSGKAADFIQTPNT